MQLGNNVQYWFIIPTGLFARKTVRGNFSEAKTQWSIQLRETTTPERGLTATFRSV